MGETSGMVEKATCEDSRNEEEVVHLVDANASSKMAYEGKQYMTLMCGLSLPWCEIASGRTKIVRGFLHYIMVEGQVCQACKQSVKARFGPVWEEAEKNIKEKEKVAMKGAGIIVPGSQQPGDAL